MTVAFRQADAEALPFADESFDVVLSTFGVMFTPNQEQAAGELARVVRKGGRIGLANWMPDGFIGHLFKIIGKYILPPAGIKSPALRGTPSRLAELFPDHHFSVTEQVFQFCYISAAHWLDVFKTYYEPTQRAFASLDSEQQVALQAEILALLERFNRSVNGSLIVASAYLEVVITKR